MKDEIRRMKKDQGKIICGNRRDSRYFAGYRFAISVKNPSFSTSFKKLMSTNCSGLADFACGICGASVSGMNWIPLSVGKWAYTMVRQVTEMNEAVTRAAGVSVEKN